jgi:hypothetical protein
MVEFTSENRFVRANCRTFALGQQSKQAPIADAAEAARYQGSGFAS